MKDILVIYVARLGDTLLITPILRHLKALYPDARLTFFGHKRSIDLVYHLPFLDHIDCISKSQAPFLGWLGNRYDLALVYGQDQALIRYAERCSRQIICFDQPSFKPSKRTIIVPRSDYLMHAVDERALLLKPLEADLLDKSLYYHVTHDEQRWADQFVADRWGRDHCLIALKPQSFVDKSYRDWPFESVLAFCKAFLNLKPQSHFLLLGGAEDHLQLKPLVDALSGQATLLAGQLKLRQTAALMSRSRFYLGVDTGLTHLAGALRLPMVALYHCRHRGRYLAPLHHPLCGVIDHPCPDHLCSANVSMADITPDHVMEVVRGVLQINPDGLG